MNTRTGLSFRPKACQRCGGDAYLSRGEDVEWVCLQCGRTVGEPVRLVHLELAADPQREAVVAGTAKREAA